MLARTIDDVQSDSADRVSFDIARAAIAACILGEKPAQLRIGDITLHPHQRSAVTRIQRILSDHRGALLCDDVGLGKTYVALAVAARYDSITIVAPASLSQMWHHALSVTHISAELVSSESLGRSGAPQTKRTLIIVDEAHHFRNSCTRRYSALARMCMLAPVVLLTATPLHNSRDDVSALAALFVGSRAYAMSDAELAQTVVRRDSSGDLLGHDVPVVEHVLPRVLITDETMLDMILALPAPVPPSDGNVATRLVVHGLVRQWASSNAALIGALKRRIARSHGLLASLDAGRYPSAAELSAWVYISDAVQLAFAELLVPATIPLLPLAVALRKHVAALANLLSCARSHDDRALSTFVRDIRASHPTEKIVAFSCYAETAEALYRSLKQDGHAALLTARGAMIASGPVSRSDILEQFAPSVPGRVVEERESVNLLITTDLLSEGVNLQQASVIIQLDLPWTSARVEQRIGRLARMGSSHPCVISYSLNPPPRAEAFLRELEIVARKSDLSSQVFGGSMTTNFPGRAAQAAPIQCGEHVRTILETWRRVDTNALKIGGTPLVSFASAPDICAIGAWIVDGVPTLLVWDQSNGIAIEAVRTEAAMELASTATETDDTPAGGTHLPRVLRDVATWYDHQCAWRAVGGIDGFVMPHRGHDARRSLARVADAASANVGFAHRFESAAVATRLRTAAATPLPLAVEWSLESLSDCADDAAVNTILDLVDRARPLADHVKEKGIRCVALIMFGPAHPDP